MSIISKENNDIEMIKLLIQECIREIEFTKKSRERNPEYQINKSFPLLVYKNQYHL